MRRSLLWRITKTRVETWAFHGSLGAKVVAAKDGFEGRGDKDLPAAQFLSDIAMPGMDGFQLLRKIRALGAAPADKYRWLRCPLFLRTLTAIKSSMPGSKHVCQSAS